MKILVVSARLPFPADDGWKMRTSALIRSLAAHGHEVDLLTYLNGEDVETSMNGQRECLREIVTVERAKSYAPTDLLRGLVMREPFSVHNCHQEDFGLAMRELTQIRRYDAVQVEDVSMAQYAVNASIPLKILDMHNVESSLMRRFAQQEESPAKALYARLTARKLKRYERDVSRSFDLVTVCSGEDKALLESMGVRTKVEVIPNGVWCDAYQPSPAGRDAQEAVFIGRMDYHANISGARFLVREVLPRLLEVLPGLHLSLVGKNPVPAVRALEGPNVSVFADVPDVAPFLARASLAVVPLLVGGGTRLKILEAMACNKAVVSTRVGAEGIAAAEGTQIVLADSAEDFAQAMVRLLSDGDARRRIGDAARRFVAENYDWGIIGSALNRCIGDAQREKIREERA
ncbi:glycosyltransferase family 4 protein [Fundidesulfovibrio terrae]|uniref:glycosyltransferase family 4 protein n=1 Tax=Fundidesulfovibrio terrae TaxID=2922866 RepID=UPI001FAFB9EA|nr:glycosyltransferase family 4 protein [Fundidesulfovibrio terrae]